MRHEQSIKQILVIISAAAITLVGVRIFTDSAKIQSVLSNVFESSKAKVESTKEGVSKIKNNLDEAGQAVINTKNKVEEKVEQVQKAKNDVDQAIESVKKVTN